MAATGYTPLYLYYSSTTTNIPSAGNLGYGELAINIADGYLYYKDNANAVQKIGYKLVPTTNGGTGLTSFTANQVLYASSTSALGAAPIYVSGSNVGIGGAPELTFDVQGASAQQRIYSSTGTNATYTQYRAGSTFAYVGLDGSGGASFGQPNSLVLWQSGANPVVIGTNSALAVQVSASGGVSIGNTTDPGATNLSVSGFVKTLVTTVASLPSASTVGAGARAFVTNALTPVFGSAVVGGGAVNVPVYSTGSAWFVG